MNEAQRAEAVHRLQVDIDTRIADIWITVWDDDSVLGPVVEDELQRHALTACLRMVYARGYANALTEVDEGRREALAIDNGFVGI